MRGRTDREGAGLFVTNYPAAGFLAHAPLAAIRPDLITVRIMGWADGATAVDYTVNAAVGLPAMTGPACPAIDVPVNHVLPAWDLLAGAHAALALLAAERDRRASGRGHEVQVPLGDVAIAGDVMPGFVARNPHWREPDADVLAAEIARAEHPFRKPAGDVNRLREALLELMWNDVGIIRERAGMERAAKAFSAYSSSGTP